MKQNLKFQGPAQADFFTTLKARVDQYFETKQLSKNANSEMYLKTLLMLGFYFVPYALFFTGQFTAFYEHMILWSVMGVGMCGIGLGIMHDANHGAYSNNPKINHLLGMLIHVVGVNQVNWKIQHNYFHHMFTNVQDHDDSLNAGPILRFSPDQKWRKIHRYQFIYIWFLYTLETFVWALATDFFRMNRYRKSGALKKHTGKETWFLFAELCFYKILYFFFILYLPIKFAGVPASWVLLGYTAMHLGVGLFLTLVFVTNHIMPESDFPTPHEGVIYNAWAVHQIRTSANYATDNKLFSWFVGGLNYQIEHHLFTNICHVHYPEISKICKATCEEFGVPYQSYPTFLSAIIAHGKTMKALGEPEIEEDFIFGI